MPYAAPVEEIRFQLKNVVEFARVQGTERFAEATDEMTDAILTEAGRMCTEILAPLQRNGDLDPARLENGVVRTSEGYAEGYRAIAEGGWIGISASPEYGGMGLPQTLASALNEMMSSACLSLQLNPLLTQGQIEALEAHASEKIKATYLPKLIEGVWSGTMNLTEPQAGSDVGALRSQAVPNGDGSYSVTGQKIYISWGDSDFVDNVCHLVLARLPDAPAGTGGISLFLVPRNLPDEAGNAGQANTLKVVSLEHKMGLHGSPTAVMQFDDAKGWLIGEENKGLATMFIMMNNARLGVGIEGLGAAEGALQQAVAYANDRKQGRTKGPTGTIIDHPDVRRMLARMKADTQTARAIALSCAVAIDMATATGDAGWAARAAFLTPIAKAFGTDTGSWVSDTGIQVHGGMGFIEETGAAQYFRDVRVTAIYEGTNGIQAIDLVTRKLADQGEAAANLIDDIEETAEAARASLPDLAQSLWSAAETLRDATESMVAADDLQYRLAGASPYLRAFARVLGGHFHLKAALAEGGDGPRTRIARFYIEKMLPEHTGLLAELTAGADPLMAITPEDLAV